jgi:hypothetical protein
MENEYTAGKAQFGQQREDNALDRIRSAMMLMSPGAAVKPAHKIGVATTTLRQQLLNKIKATGDAGGVF